MQILTYHSKNAPFHKAWVAYPVIDDLFLVRCEATTEADAIARAEAWFVKEKARQAVLVGTSEDEDESSMFNRAMDGRGQGFTGKVWMLNRSTGDRARVMPDQLQQYVARGYVQAGPRSKL
jgi:hypothetical protein